MSQEEQKTGVRDLSYNLISVIYHTTNAVTLYDTYIRDAEEEGDQECAQFLRETQEAAKKVAQKAQSLLAGHLSESQ